MGNKPSYQQEYRLEPINPPLMSTEPRFIAQQPICLKLNQDFSMTGDSYTITDMHNNPWFNVSRKFMSLKQTKTLMDLSGNPVLKLHNVPFSGGYEMNTADGRTVASVSKKLFTRSKMNISVEDKITGQLKHLTLKTRNFDRSGIIFIGEEKENGIPVGLIQRNFSFRDNYILEIAPGVDIALMLMIVLCLEELIQRKRD